MSDVKTIKGLPYIQGGTLYQEQILVSPQVMSTSQTIALISDIWADLIDGPSQCKTNGKGYFYWEVEVTDSENDDVELTIKFECPKPYGEELFERLKSSETEYGKYWANKLKTATENYEYKAAIQKKEIVFPGTQYVDPNTGDLVNVEETRVSNTDIGDITNLISMF